MIKFTHLVFLAFALLGAGIASAQELTGPPKNAVRLAELYPSMTGFSRAGRSEQLSSEYGDGYSVADATAALDTLSVDWNAQSVRPANQYLTRTGFSCKGPIDQLSSDYGNKYPSMRPHMAPNKPVPAEAMFLAPPGLILNCYCCECVRREPHDSKFFAQH